VVDIEEVLEPIVSSRSAFVIDLLTHKEAIDHDIGLYIEKRFGDTPFKSWPIEIQIEAKIALIEKADGM
jgi:hypothetical protein